jgi:hypothetical protein
MELKMSTLDTTMEEAFEKLFHAIKKDMGGFIGNGHYPMAKTTWKAAYEAGKMAAMREMKEAESCSCYFGYECMRCQSLNKSSIDDGNEPKI